MIETLYSHYDGTRANWIIQEVRESPVFDKYSVHQQRWDTNVAVRSWSIILIIYGQQLGS